MLIKKVLILIIVVSISAFNVHSVGEPTLSARSAVVINVDSGKVIFSENADERLSMASTTKIMTALLAVESGKLGCHVTASEDIICDGTAIGIKKGDTFTLETLVWAMLLESGNDAALLTAIYLAGSEEAFAVLMNEKAKEIGMNNTSFVTASGLDAEKHYTTAYDLALLGAYAVKNPIFRMICSAETKRVEYIRPDITATYSNHNKLLKMYDGVLGIKTGFTKKSGRCLVSACEKDGVILAAVTLNAPDDWNDHIKMYDYAFTKTEAVVSDIKVPTEIPVYGGTASEITLSFDEPKTNKSDDNLRYEIYLPEFIYAPVKRGDIIGKAVICSDENFVSVYYIYSCENIDIEAVNNKPEYSFWYKLKFLINNFLKG